MQFELARDLTWKAEIQGSLKSFTANTTSRTIDLNLNLMICTVSNLFKIRYTQALISMPSHVWTVPSITTLQVTSQTPSPCKSP